MKRRCIHTVLGIGLGLGLPSVYVPSATPAPGRETPSAHLHRAQQHSSAGEHAAAGREFRAAFEALREDKRRADEGAQAALLAAEAYWAAYDQDGDLGHLDAAHELLEAWLAAAGPQSSARLLPDVRRMQARVRAVREPLHEAARAETAGALASAVEHEHKALEALESQGRGWPTGARVALDLADAHRKLASEEPAGAVESLRTAAAVLEHWIAARPQSESSPLMPTLEEKLATVHAELAAAEEAAQPKTPPPPPPEPVAPPAPPPPVDRPAVAPRVLLPVGVAALAAGATLIGLGARALVLASENEDEAFGSPLYEMLPSGPRAEFDTEFEEYDAASRRYGFGMIAGGSALAAGGAAMTIVGAVRLSRERRGPSPSAMLRPWGSMAGGGMAVGGRF